MEETPFLQTTQGVAGGPKERVENFIVGLLNLFRPTCFGHRSEAFDDSTFDEWVNLAEAPALQASLRLYREVEQLGFKIVLITGRIEPQRNVTEKNLVYAGYSNWERLFLRGRADSGKQP
ncbi:Acid phosphatase 1 [Vitis vinifera]|uniref:Acid phosphatase 1 n=1 Tax=Vitis vinifera TaxID=29760 RepID=A0A438DRZ4_VITVI|nr:Acid phosphatase 1 [Vitis vinifera]